ncbi:MAG: EscU/YscU/HrcU family type III secretion system export apparatus switch protein [Acidobacteria bacterium]|nr:EscU/YscU/HrcU family type III secretion system export apparatus switch protein [Acidobacteriota bacterium]MBI3662999.1 EscU/YscU/HrcU family type III secretion system export apparatus switch protein [Acidobacteriota bacterium]
MSDGNKTEQATPRRRQKAREKGRVARSQELPAALVLFTAVLLLWWQPLGVAAPWRDFFRQILNAAVSSELTVTTPVLAWSIIEAVRWAAPVVLAAWCMAVAAMLAQGGFIFSPAALAPDVARFNPVSNLGHLFSFAGLSRLLKSLIPMAVLAYLFVSVMRRDWAGLLHANRMGVRAALGWMMTHAFEFAWKGALVMLFWSGADYFLQRFHFERSLRMSQQEIREEAKEAEVNPEVRRRLRRLQLEMRRKRMVQDVSRATVVITNPNEYAIALEYQPETMPAPLVIAKGRNRLAQQIKQAARWHGIPLVENRPLAQALYRAVEVGQAIPEKLYTAVAEILAFIYRAQARAQAAAAGHAAGRRPVEG